jgi:hypothetical protein
MSRDDKYLLRTNADGTRQASWRIWVLVWLLPAVFLGACGYLTIETLYLRSATVETEGEVTHIYRWENDAPQVFYPGEHVYSPRFKYTWTDGNATEATPGRSHPGWNFEIGSRHVIRYDPDEKGDVIVAGPTEWLVLRYILWFTAGCTVLSLIGHLLVRRWLGKGLAA